MLPSLQVDAITYHELATRIAADGSLSHIPARQPPGFVVLLAGLYVITGPSYLAARLTLWICFVVTVGLAAWTARRVWGSGVAATAAALVATAPALRHYVGTVQYEVLVGAWFLALLAGIHASLGSKRTWAVYAGVAASGASAGALTLTREVFIGILPIVALWIAWWPETLVRARRQSVTAALLFLAVAALPIGAWSVQQSARVGQTVIISDKGPVTFALGNNPRASGTYNVDVIEEPSGLAFVKSRPLDALFLLVRKVGYFWGVLRDGWNVPRAAPLRIHRASFGLLPMDVVGVAARGGWLLLAFVIGTAWLFYRGAVRGWWILPASVAAICAAHALTLASHRFAVPMLPVVFVIAAGPVAAGLHSSLRWLLASPRRLHATAGVLVVAITAQWGPWPAEMAFRAAEVEALNAVNARDTVLGETVRFVAAADGARTAMVLADEYLPSGPFRLLLTMRRGSGAIDQNLAVARVVVTDLEGSVVCSRDIPAGDVPDHSFGDIWVPCDLRGEGPVSFVVQTSGAADLAFHELVIVRNPA